MLMFHGNLVHASGSNLTPWSRWIVYLSLNRCDNAIRRFKRPTGSPTATSRRSRCAPDDCLVQYARAHRTAADDTRTTGGPMNLHRLLREREDAGKPLRVGLIGAGKFGSMYLAQAQRTPGMHLRRRRRSRARRARGRRSARVGWPAERIAARSLGRGATQAARRIVTDDAGALIAHPAARDRDRRDRQPGGRHPPRARVLRARQARRDGQRRGRCARRAAARAPRARRRASSIRSPTATSRR